MKKTLCFLLYLIALYGIYATAVPSLTDSSSWIPENVLIGTGNDKWTFGLSRNNDDQLSYSGNIRVEAPVWTLSLDLNGYTNRGWKDAWYNNQPDSDPDHFFHGRYDTIDLAFALKWFPVGAEHWELEIAPRLGFLMAGNYGFDYFQNLVHRISRIHLVDLPYETGNFFAPKVSARVESRGFWRLPDKWGDLTDIGVGVSFDTENNIGFETSQYIGTELFLRRDREKLLALSLGYIWYQQYTDWSTQRLALWFEQGLRLGFEINAGALSVNYWYALQNTFGYTTYYVDVMSFFQKSTWKENDLIITLASSRILKQTYHTLEVQTQLFDSRWALLMTNRYIAGNPIDKKAEAENDPGKFARLKLAFSLWSFGIKYEVPDGWSKGWCTPFVSLSLGMERFEFAILDNMLPHESTPWTTWAEYSFIMDAEFGVSLFPAGWLKAGNAAYRLIVSGGVTWIANAENVAYMFLLANLTDYDVDKIFHFIPRLTVGLQIGFDL
jgi:hypothetical protein